MHNDLYNSNGINAAEYKFDYPDEFFDFACAISVFTHMIDTEVDNYLKETAKVMKYKFNICQVRASAARLN